MRSLALIAISFAALTGCSPETPKVVVEAPTPSVEPAPLDPNASATEQAALAPCGAVTADGYCGVTFGMTPADAQKKFPVKLGVYAGGDPNDVGNINRCFELFAAEPVQVSFLAENNKVGRVDLLSEGPKTADGFGVGTTADAIHTKFGSAVVEARNKYEPEIVDLTVTQGAAKFIFEIQDGKVRAWRAGVPPTIDYAEHCG